MLLIAIVGFAVSSCLSEDQRFEREVSEIESFIAETGMEFTPSGTGLYYRVDVAGDQNRIPDSLNHVSFKHRGYLLDSTIFSEDWSPSQNVQMQYLVRGFQEGLEILGEGGRGVIIFPSSLGYGKEGASTVPAYSPLMFELELVNYY